MAFATRVEMVKLAGQVEAMQVEIAGMNQSIGTLRGDQSIGLQRFAEATQKLSDQTERSIAEIRMGGDTLYEETKRKFEEMSASLHVTFAEVKKKLDELDAKQQTSHGGEKSRSYLPLKSMVPRRMDHDITKWRAWRDDVLDYLDAVNSGIKEFLKGATKIKDVDFDDYLADANYMNDKDFGKDDSLKVWRALKELTEGEARRVVSSG